MSRYYAVKRGKTPGIYDSWEECRQYVDNFPGCVYKAFDTVEEAQQFIDEKVLEYEDGHMVEDNFAFTRGIFNPDTMTYGFGGFLVHNGERILLQGAGHDEKFAALRDCAGELFGCMVIVQQAIKLGMEEITIYYDYNGIEMWTKGNWTRKNEGSERYFKFMEKALKKIKINFIHQKRLYGIEDCELAEELAKEAAKVTEKPKKY